MDQDKEKQEISLIGRIFSLDVLLIIMGIISLVSGIIYRNGTRIFWGVVVLIGGSLLMLVLRKGYSGKQ